jgi:hypothetical protein
VSSKYGVSDVKGSNGANDGIVSCFGLMSSSKIDVDYGSLAFGGYVLCVVFCIFLKDKL